MKFELNYLFKIYYSKNLLFNYLLSNKVRGRSGPIGQSATLLAPIRRDFGDVWQTRACITQVQGPTNEYLVSYERSYNVVDSVKTSGVRFYIIK